MPRRRATAMLGAFAEGTCHSTRWMPRSSTAQSIRTRTARVTSPRPTAAGSSQQPASAVPCTTSIVRRSTPPTSVPSAVRMPRIRPVSVAAFCAYAVRKARADSTSRLASASPTCRPMNSRPRSMWARNSSACHGSSGRSSVPSSPSGIPNIAVLHVPGCAPLGASRRELCTSPPPARTDFRVRRSPCRSGCCAGVLSGALALPSACGRERDESSGAGWCGAGPVRGGLVRGRSGAGRSGAARHLLSAVPRRSGSGPVCPRGVRCRGLPAGVTPVSAARRETHPGTAAGGQDRRWPIRRGFCSRPSRPCQARLTRCAATSAFFGLRTLSHHCPVRATMPTRAWA